MGASDPRDGSSILHEAKTRTCRAPEASTRPAAPTSGLGSTTPREAAFAHAGASARASSPVARRLRGIAPEGIQSDVWTRRRAAQSWGDRCGACHDAAALACELLGKHAAGDDQPDADPPRSGDEDEREDPDRRTNDRRGAPEAGG